MPSLIDIPAHLLSYDKQDDFLAWVKRLPSETWIRRDLCRAWQKYNYITFTVLDYKKAGLQMPQKFAHLLPEDVEVWLRFLNLHGSDYTLFEYDIRVGLGRDPGLDFPENIRQMALDLSFRRIDVVAHSPTEITVIEVTHSAGFKALGQIIGYPILYSLTFLPLLPIKPLLVCSSIQSDIQPIIESLTVPYVIV